ncbi:MAG: DUF2461 domain-containing protein, partial [Actinomycetota bacterium]
FKANKERYEEEVLEPALNFIRGFAPSLRKLSPYFVADARPSGGSLFRIYRDVRFSRDKSPYKTHVGIQFRHKQAKDVHAPGFYLHLEPGNVFAGVGMWRPDSTSVAKIRDAIADDPKGWKRAAHGDPFSALYELDGDSLKRPPGGYDGNHPFVEDLKRKDFIGVASIAQRSVTSNGFIRDYAHMCRAARPFMRFLCESVGVPF